MHKLVILFRRPAQEATFEMRYTRNLALLAKMPGVRHVEDGTVLGSPAGDAPYARTIALHFDDFAALDAALTAPEGVAAGKDLMDFAPDAELLFVEASDERTQQPLTPDNLRAYLAEQGIPAEVFFPGAPTPTVAAAAQALGVEPDQIVKTVIFLVDGTPFAVFGCGLRRVDPAKLAQRLNISLKKVRLANADEVQNLTGYPVGTVPPLGLKTPMPAFIDPAVQRYDVIYAGGGGINALLKITPADLIRYSRAEVAPMLADDDPPPAPPAARPSEG